MSKPISRASFLKGLAALGAVGISGKLLSDFAQSRPPIEYRWLGPSMNLGHKMRDRQMVSSNQPTVVQQQRAVTIVGGGIAGLSAAWWLKRNGFSDFTLLELEKNVGGNSSSGKNSISAYPWGAHYVPLANAESKYVRTLFEELGVITGYDNSGTASYNELYLCHDPQERLLKDGSFHEGLVPRRGLHDGDKAEMARFFALMQKYRDEVGTDKKHAFSIPIALSSDDARFRDLDKLSMADWLQSNSFHSRPLLWYVNYCCRDDYGASPENVSAWAGIHYFAGRRGVASNAEHNSVVTWPEGNGFLVEQLRSQLKDHIVTGKVVTQLKPEHSGVLVRAFDGESQSEALFQSKCAIFAAPRFIAGHVVDAEQAIDPKALVYAPWLVANISLNSAPRGAGTGLAWDNVNYNGKSLGYVVATHQDITTRASKTVITYYYPLSENAPASSREELRRASPKEWGDRIVKELEAMHPGIEDQITSIEMWPWGHGMISPATGFVWGDTRRKMQDSVGNIFFAHSDMSGISNFEEAQYHGVEAAKKVLSCLGHGERA